MSTQLHNPDNLTEWGQSEGWRLLTVEEMSHSLPKDAEYLDGEDAAWCASSYRGEVARIVDQKHTTYRTREPVSAQPTETDDLTYYETTLPAVIAGVRRGEKWEYKLGDHWILAADSAFEYLAHHLDLGYRVRLAPVPVVKTMTVDELIEKYDDLREFTRSICLQLQKHRGLSDGQKDELFQLSYRKYVQHDVEKQPRPCVKPEGGK